MEKSKEKLKVSNVNKKTLNRAEREVVAKELIRDLARIPARQPNLSEAEVRKFYFNTKMKVMELEKINAFCIVLYYRSKSFWQMGDNSALIYYYRLAREMKLRNVNLRIDSDYSKGKWKYGYVMVSNIERTIGNLLAVGCKVSVNTPEVKILALPERVEEGELEVWAHSREEKQARFNVQAMPKVAYPQVYQCASILHREVIVKLVNLTMPKRHYYGDEGAEIVTWLARKIISVMNGRMDAMEYFEEALRKLDELNDWLVCVDKFEVFDVDANLRIMTEMTALKSEIKMQKKLLEKRMGIADEAEGAEDKAGAGANVGAEDKAGAGANVGAEDKAGADDKAGVKGGGGKKAG